MKPAENGGFLNFVEDRICVKQHVVNDHFSFQKKINDKNSRNKILQKNHEIIRVQFYISIEGDQYSQYAQTHNDRRRIFRSRQLRPFDLQKQIPKTKKCHYR